MTVFAACGDDDAPSADGSIDAQGPDGGFGFPDGSVFCETDAICEDGVPCTNDFCDDLGVCRNVPDSEMCSDDVFCNGIEICDRLIGCTMGLPETCSDGDVCTLDRCIEETKTCERRPRDFDEDGEVDWHCEDGTDCDDRDPARGSLVSEVCMDLVDNDCDEDIDEPGCGRPPNDVCEDALDVSGGGSFLMNNGGALPDYGVACAPAGRRDVVITFTLTEESDVRISAEGTGVTTVALRTNCTDFASELECGSGFPGVVRARSLAPGTYWAIISDSSIGEIQVEVSIDPPTDPPTNESCAMPRDLGTGGVIAESFVDVSDDLVLRCGSSGSPDLVYQLTTTAPHDVRITAVADTGDSMTFEVRRACTDSASVVRCARGAPAGSTLHELPAGTYFIIVEGPGFREVDFTLDVQILPPTPVPRGDSCADPIPLVLGTPTLGTLADKEDDHDTSCGFYYQDAVYSFTIPSRSDVAVTVDGGTTFMAQSVRRTCTDSADLRCTSGAPSRARLRDLAAGTYYVIAESYRGTSFNITVDASPPTPTIPVTGNDTCATAYVVPATTGGLFTGNTTTLANDLETRAGCGSMARSRDAVFRLDLTARKRIVASTEGSSFDTVLHVHNTACASGGERYCDDDGGDGVTSLVEQVLDPGTWYFVVDGFGDTSMGDYTFELRVYDP